LTNGFQVPIIKSLLEKQKKVRKRRSTFWFGLSERGSLVGKPQQHRMEAVFSVSLVSSKETGSAVE